MKRYSGSNMNAWSQWRMPYLFEYTDPVAQIGFRHTVYTAFTGDTYIGCTRTNIYKGQVQEPELLRDRHIDGRYGLKCKVKYL